MNGKNGIDFDSVFPLSGYQDSNLGPSAPKADALTGLRYTPNFFACAKIGKKKITPNFSAVFIRNISPLRNEILHTEM